MIGGGEGGGGGIGAIGVGVGSSGKGGGGTVLLVSVSAKETYRKLFANYSIWEPSSSHTTSHFRSGIYLITVPCFISTRPLFPFGTRGPAALLAQQFNTTRDFLPLARGTTTGGGVAIGGSLTIGGGVLIGGGAAL